MHVVAQLRWRHSQFACKITKTTLEQVVRCVSVYECFTFGRGFGFRAALFCLRHTLYSLHHVDLHILARHNGIRTNIEIHVPDISLSLPLCLTHKMRIRFRDLYGDGAKTHAVKQTENQFRSVLEFNLLPQIMRSVASFFFVANTELVPSRLSLSRDFCSAALISSRKSQASVFHRVKADNSFVCMRSNAHKLSICRNFGE